MEQQEETELIQIIKKRCRVSPCNLAIIAVNILVFIAAELLLRYKNTELAEYGALSADLVWGRGEFYRLITYMFLHAGMEHLVNNMLILWFLGDILEKQIGHIKYFVLYFSTGILAGIASMGYNVFIGRTVICVGASGAIFGVVGAVAFLIAANRGRLEGLTTRQIVMFLLLSLYGGLTSQGVDNAAHIGGAAAGILEATALHMMHVLAHKGRMEDRR